MSVSFATSIAVPIAKKPIRLTFIATSGNYIIVWCSAAPVGSKLRIALDKNTSSRVHVTAADSGKAFDYTFDVAGAYQLVAQEIVKGAAPYGGGYQYAPDAAPAEQLLGETVLSFYVAAGLKGTLGFGADTADLVLYVADTLIQPTTLAVHGIATPAIQKPKSDKASTAAQNAAVIAAITALGGAAASVSLGALASVANNIILNFNEHISSAVFHATADFGDNLISTDFKSPTTPDAMKRTVGKILKNLSNHIRNDSYTASPNGTGSAAWHQDGGFNVVDWTSLPLFESSSKIAEHVRALADAWRSYKLHRISLPAHLVADNVNVCAALPPLLNIHELFLAELAKLSPSAPLTDNSAKTLLVHGAGFEEL